MTTRFDVATVLLSKKSLDRVTTLKDENLTLALLLADVFCVSA
jgi:hypothetical protein